VLNKHHANIPARIERTEAELHIIDGLVAKTVDCWVDQMQAQFMRSVCSCVDFSVVVVLLLLPFLFLVVG